MMKRILICILPVAISATACEWPQRHLTDKKCIVMENMLSPNKKFRLLTYRFAAGAFDDGRVFWAVTPADAINPNLVSYELPDGYQTIGWTVDNELRSEERRVGREKEYTRRRTM